MQKFRRLEGKAANGNAQHSFTQSLHQGAAVPRYGFREKDKAQ